MKKNLLTVALLAAFIVPLPACGRNSGENASVEVSAVFETPVPTPAPTATPVPTATPEPTATPVPYVSPIDFDELKAGNPDIYAWIRLDGTNIDYPVLQSLTDDAFYLDHDSDGNYSQDGSVFSESAYNTDDFSDPVTILYGHHMKSGAIFGNLEHYFTDSEFLADDHVIDIYTPDEHLEFTVFAAVPFSDEHIMYNRDFSDPQVFDEFFSFILSTENDYAHFYPEHIPAPGDRVVILATCYYRDGYDRFLVMGVCPQSE